MTHPHPEQIDPRDWCGRCGTHVATEILGIDRGGTPSTMLCPVCEDEGRRQRGSAQQSSHDRGDLSCTPEGQIPAPPAPAQFRVVPGMHGVAYTVWVSANSSAI